MANPKSIPTPNALPPIPDSFENVIKTLVKPKPKRPNVKGSVFMLCVWSLLPELR